MLSRARSQHEAAAVRIYRIVRAPHCSGRRRRVKPLPSAARGQETSRRLSNFAYQVHSLTTRADVVGIFWGVGATPILSHLGESLVHASKNLRHFYECVLCAPHHHLCQILPSGSMRGHTLNPHSGHFTASGIILIRSHLPPCELLATLSTLSSSPSGAQSAGKAMPCSGLISSRGGRLSGRTAGGRKSTRNKVAGTMCATRLVWPA